MYGLGYNSYNNARPNIIKIVLLIECADNILLSVCQSAFDSSLRLLFRAKQSFHKIRACSDGISFYARKQLLL